MVGNWQAAIQKSASRNSGLRDSTAPIPRGGLLERLPAFTPRRRRNQEESFVAPSADCGSDCLFSRISLCPEPL
jgi:hypothetical protein